MTAPATQSDKKAALRAAILAERPQWAKDTTPFMLRELAGLFLHHFAPEEQSVVAAYVPVRGELDPMPLLRAAVAAGAQAALPRVVAKDQPLEFRAYNVGAPLAVSAYNIPAPDEKSALVRPDYLLVPLVAVDGRGYRLGYGGGYYDRTLAQHRPSIVIGLAYEQQIVDEVPHEAHDAPLDYVMTPRHVFVPKQ